MLRCVSWMAEATWKSSHLRLRPPLYLWKWHTSHKSWHWFSFRSQDSLQGSRHCEKETGVRSSKVTASKTVVSTLPLSLPVHLCNKRPRLLLLQVPDIITSKRTNDLLSTRTWRKGGVCTLLLGQTSRSWLPYWSWQLCPIPTKRLINDTLTLTMLGFPF